MNQESEIQTVYEDENILAINKPSGVLVHAAASGVGGKTVADWVLAKYPGMKNVGEPMRSPRGDIVPRPGIVHRLDKDTSGILVLAKNQETFELLKKLFTERRIEKEYRAIVHGALKEKEGVIDLPIARSAKDFRRKSVHPRARGRKREAITRYRVLVGGKDFSYLSVFPKTGRTHQIRVHLQALQHPIVCDPIYAGKRICPSEVGRLGLHAYALTIPMKGSIIRLEAPIPDAFVRFSKAHISKLSQ